MPATIVAAAAELTRSATRLSVPAIPEAMTHMAPASGTRKTHAPSTAGTALPVTPDAMTSPVRTSESVEPLPWRIHGRNDKATTVAPPAPTTTRCQPLGSPTTSGWGWGIILQAWHPTAVESASAFVAPGIPMGNGFDRPSLGHAEFPEWIPQWEERDHLVSLRYG